MEKVFVPDATNFCTIKQMQQDYFFIMCLATIATIDLMTMPAHAHAEEKHVRDNVVGA